ncbi:MAG: hypothetical protein Q8P31_00230 [Bacillota bacterium]|nr:hypothetical protein [Bacillota bacterium]
MPGRKIERSFRTVFEWLFGRRTMTSLQNALACVVRPILFAAIVLLFLLVLFWYTSKGLLLVLFLLFLALIGLLA